MKRWKHRPEGSTWGDWGDDDQLGRLNLITPKKVIEGIAEVKEGISFCLSLPLDFPGGNVLNPRRLPPVLSPTGDENGWRFNFLTNSINPLFMDVASDDRVILTLQYSTQWDTLAHVGGMFDADGQLLFTDRKKDMIKTGGENVPSIKVETVLLRHDAVANAVAIGLPHPRWIEAVTAFIVCKPDSATSEDDIIQHCKAHLGGFEVPKSVVFVDSLPMTATGKVQKQPLRQQYHALYDRGLGAED